ncbi:MAG: hypothetical protein ACNA71_02835 [Kiritimatiellia bacterium]
MKMIASRRGGILQSGMLTLLVLGLILAVTGWFAARTQGFRELVAGRLSEQLGIAVVVGESYVGWPYVLVLRNVESGAHDAVSFQIRAMRLGRGLRQWTLDVRGARITFAPEIATDVTRAISGELVRLAGLRDAEPLDIMRATSHLQSRWRVQLDDFDIYWLDADGEVDGYVRQLHFQLVPVRLPSGKMHYYRLSYPGAARQALGSIRDLDWEWLTRGGDHYVELMRNGMAAAVCPME